MITLCTVVTDTQLYYAAMSWMVVSGVGLLAIASYHAIRG
jgi:hypothetical protein